jgi:uncharacterized RDD family membrane protein YckC
MDEQIHDTELDKPKELFNGYASFWERFGAAFVDGLVTSAVGYMILGAFGINFIDLFQITSKGMDPIATFGKNFYWASILSFVFDWFYFVQQEISEHQATLGKRLMGLIVTDINGERLGFWQASYRFVLKQIFQVASLCSSFISQDVIGTVMIMSLAGYLIQPFTKQKQALHDLIGKTLVYRK